MKEFDFDTEEGRKEAKEYFKELVKPEHEDEFGELLFSMMDLIVNHEVRFINMKNIL